MPTTSLRAPVGQWEYLWDSDQTPETWQQIIARARAHGLGILIKAWDGEWRWERQWNPQVIALFNAANVPVAPWGYAVGDWQGPSPDNPAGPSHACTIEIDAQCAAWAASLAGGFVVLNMEIEWCSQPDASAAAYVARVRELVGPEHGVFASTIINDTGHWAGYPWRQIAAGVDGMMPQLYLWEWNLADVAAAWVARGLRYTGGKPTYPTFDLFNNAGELSPPDYLDRAIAAAVALGLTGVSYWRTGQPDDGHGGAMDRAAALLRTALTAAATPGDADDAADLIGGALPRSDPHTALLDAYDRAARNGFRYLLGDRRAAGHADLSQFGPDLPTRVRWLECEKAVLWCADSLAVDALHPGQLAELIAAGRAVRDG